jgi:hypothetical protein
VELKHTVKPSTFTKCISYKNKQNNRLSMAEERVIAVFHGLLIFQIAIGIKEGEKK